MLPQDKLNRLNQLARKAKTAGLSDAERDEQTTLREEYLRNFRAQFRNHLDNIEFVDDDSSKRVQ